MIGLNNLVAFVLFMMAMVSAAPAYPDNQLQFNRDFMHFGKRSANVYDLDGGDFNRRFLNFGKRDYAPMDQIYTDKKNFNREFLHFGKRAMMADENGLVSRDFMHFGKRR